MTITLSDGGTLLLRTDAGPRIGIGHLRRCLAIAEVAASRGARPIFVLGECDAESLAWIKRAGWPHVTLPADSHFDLAAYQTATPSPTVTIFDISHRTAIGHAATLADVVAGLSAAGSRVMLIDQPGDSCLAAAASLPLDMLVFPYLGAEQQEVRPGPARTLKGCRYAILDAAYIAAGAESRSIEETARRVLVTAGGGDPAGITGTFLKALSDESVPELDVHVVLGPAYTESTVGRIRELTATSRHSITLINAPTELAKEMMWCDVALSASGVTKYELACTGTPAMLLSVDTDHGAMNRPFDELGVAIDLGVVGDIAPHDIATNLADLLSDADRRTRMSAVGRNAVDGRGGERLFAALDEAIAA